MSNYTEHYNLKKPLKTESYDVDVANTNNDIIDEKLYGKVDKVAGKGLSENDFTDGYKKKVDNLVEGIKGDSAYQIAVQNGFEGSETDWLTSLKGSDGKQGIQGEKGESNILTIGTVEKGEEASASVTGESPNQKLNLVLPKGDTGGKGEKGDTPIKGTDYFTEQEIQAIKNSILSQVNQFNIQVVQQLPTGKIDTHTIYFVPKASQKQNDIYEEYIYINNSWEHIGTLETNLSDYYTKDEINNKVDGKTIPAGGTVGQILTKKSDSDYDTQWQNPIPIIDNLESTDTKSVLSAKQGKVLNDTITNLESTEWQNATLNSGVTGFIRYRKQGKRVYVEGTVTTSVPSESRNLTQLPAEYKPKNQNYVFWACSGARICRGFAQTDGRIVAEWVKNISDANNYTSSTWLNVRIDYDVD